jgi:hypothetical protein
MSVSFLALRFCHTRSGEGSIVPNRSASTLFLIVERAIVSLYDGGVLSPAVLERVMGAFAVDDVDWQTDTSLRSVDGRSLHEIVVSTMMPAAPQESVAESFLAVVAHLTDEGATPGIAREEAQPQKSQRTARKKPQPADDDADSDELLAQLSGSAAPAGKRRTDTAKRPRVAAGFNPFANAALPRRK